MATVAAAPHAPTMDAVKQSNSSAEDRPAPLNQDQIEAEDDSVEANSTFGSEMYSFPPLAPVGFNGLKDGLVDGWAVLL